MSGAKLSEREKPVALVRALTAKDGLMIVIGSVIGSGIFLVPYGYPYNGAVPYQSYPPSYNEDVIEGRDWRIIGDDEG